MQERTKWRRIKRIHLDPETLLDAIQGKVQYALNLPKDATLISAGYDYQAASFVLAIGSREFEPVDLGEIAPRLDYMINRVDQEKPKEGLSTFTITEDEIP